MEIGCGHDIATEAPAEWLAAALPVPGRGGMSMDLQIVLPDESPDMAPGTLIELGREAEQLGFHTAWLPDHLLPPAPYGDVYGGVYEPLITLSYLAAVTSTMRLWMSVLVLPLREPTVLAKQVATLDRLSGGRFSLGVGTGWEPAEFAAVGADFAARGTRTDESIRALRRLFTGDVDGVFAPVPGPVPIVVGGTSTRALRRAAELGDAWQGVGLSPSEFARCVRRLRAPTSRRVHVGTRVEWRGGEIDRAVADVCALAAAGADEVAVWFGPVDGTRERMARFAQRVLR